AASGTATASPSAIVRRRRRGARARATRRSPKASSDGSSSRRAARSRSSPNASIQSATGGLRLELGGEAAQRSRHAGAGGGLGDAQRVRDLWIRQLLDD